MPAVWIVISKLEKMIQFKSAHYAIVKSLLIKLKKQERRIERTERKRVRLFL